MPVDPVSAPPAYQPPPTAAPPPRPQQRDFASALAAQLDDPRAEIAEVRANIAAIRSGRPSTSTATPKVRAGADIAERLRAWSAHGTGAEDPYGWRALSRTIGDGVIGGGFGALFERQIQQESGFAPEIVFGQRRSSAGAEGIAQLMPQFYPGVDRTDPQASLVAAAESMKHYLAAFDGDVRKALASYNAGMGRVQQLVAAHGANWERALPLETQQYLAAIVGDASGRITPSTGAASGVFGGRGPGGVLTTPLDRVLGRVSDATGLLLRGASGAEVRAPADAIVASVMGGAMGSLLTLDHGNGWQTTLDGLASLSPRVGERVTRGSVLGLLGTGDGSEASLRLGLSGLGRSLDPRSYLLGLGG
jgi:murein DD-endopeptidase MepM/ murein hydrolase activator NlpD